MANAKLRVMAKDVLSAVALHVVAESRLMVATTFTFLRESAKLNVLVAVTLACTKQLTHAKINKLKNIPEREQAEHLKLHHCTAKL